MQKHIAEPLRTIPVALEVDVIVAGGGPGGLCAAVAAARNGARVALIERYGFLGGMATAGLVNPFMPFHLHGEPMTRGIFEEWIDGMRRRGGYLDKGTLSSNIIGAEAAKASALELVLKAGVQLVLHAFVDNVLLDGAGSRIEHVCVAAKQRFAAAGKMFIDATGDADVVARMGLPVFRREQVQPPTMCAILRGLDAIRKKHPGFNVHRVIFDTQYPQALKPGFSWCHSVPGGRDEYMLAGTRVFNADCSDAGSLSHDLAAAARSRLANAAFSRNQLSRRMKID